MFQYLIPTAHALEHRWVELWTGPRITLNEAIENVVTFLAASIVSICIVLFLLGAVYVVLSHGKPDLLEKGKKTMIGSLVGLAIVLGSYAILRTLFYVLYTGG